MESYTKNKLITHEETKAADFIKNPVIIKNTYNTNEISERMLKNLILEDISSFMKELGDGFSFIDSEYKIKIANIDNYKCYFYYYFSSNPKSALDIPDNLQV